METTARLIVVAGGEGTAALVESLRAQGAVVYRTRSREGCLRVATAVRPDMIVLPRGFPRRLVRLLQQHPMSARAKIVWLQGAADQLVTERAAPRQVTARDLARAAGQLSVEWLEPAGPVLG